MTNRDVVDVLQWFNDFSEAEYARSGNIATRDVILPQGPLEDFSHTIEPHLRKLGLPTALERGVVTLIKEYQVHHNTTLYRIDIIQHGDNTISNLSSSGSYSQSSYNESTEEMKNYYLEFLVPTNPISVV